MPDSFSVDHLKTWTKCRKKYELKFVRKLNWPSNPKNFRLGKGVHQLLDYESHHFPIAPIIRDADGDIVETWQMLSQSSWAKLPVITSEWGFSLEVDGGWFYGRVDRIARDGDKVLILDWKTGTGIPFVPEEDWQTLIYLYAVFEAQRDLGLAPLAPENLTFTYVQVKNREVKAVNIPYSHARHEATLQRLTESVNSIRQAQRYPLPEKCPDKYCPYHKICGIQAQEPQLKATSDI